MTTPSPRACEAAEKIRTAKAVSEPFAVIIQSAMDDAQAEAQAALVACRAAGITKPEGLKELIKLLQEPITSDGEREWWFEELHNCLTACGIETEDKEE